MPMYPFKCEGESCGLAFDEMRRIADRDAPMACPECGGNAKFYLAGLTGIGYIDYIGVPPTVGQQAERNARRIGKELLALKQAAVKKSIDPSTITGPPD